MLGEPKDVEGECNAHLHIGDDYGDNHATMRCELPFGHEGVHNEAYQHGNTHVVVSWDENEKEDFCNSALEK